MDDLSKRSFTVGVKTEADDGFENKPGKTFDKTAATELIKDGICQTLIQDQPEDNNSRE